MQGDDPPYLPVGTAVSAKYKGAFCEAKVSKVVRCVKCKITFKMGLGTATVTDEQVRGPLRVGHTVQARHSEKKEFIEATITKIQDCSQYTVVFDDGDITTLRRTALCLKSGRHFNESETLDQLPLTHPEHFGNPVVGGRRGRRSRQLKEDSSEGEGEEVTEPDLDLYSSDIGKVVCVEGNDKKKSRDNWFPGLVVVPSAQPTVRINVREEYLVRSFKDGRYYTVPKKEISEFSRDMGARVESPALTEAMEKAIKYLDRDELPVHWERGTLFDLQVPESDSDENFSDSSDDEPREEKDHFVAQLYKFMDDRGTPLNKSPMIASRDVDLYRLFRVVQKLGGYNRVTNQTKWRSVTIRLGYPHNHATYNSVKQAYKKFLFSFEEFYRKLGCTMINHPRNAKKHRGRSLIRDRDRATPVNNSSPRPDEASSVEPSPAPAPIVVEKKEEPEKQETPKRVEKVKTTDAVKTKVPVEKEPEEKQPVKKEPVVEATDTSSSSSECTVDTQSDSSTATKQKEEPKKKTESKQTRDKKVKSASGDKVKALVEQFEEHTKKEKESKKEEDDKVQQTRSKSQAPSKSKEQTSPDRKDTPSKSTKIQKKQQQQQQPAQQQQPPQEEDKKRGRKRKDTDTTENNKVQSETTTDPTSSTQPVNVGDKLKVYYGPTHESKVTYEAKVLEIDRDSAGIIYLVHYTGWNTRYDEWIKPGRIAENLSLTTKAKRLKQAQQTPGKQSSSQKPAAKRGRGTSVSSRTQDAAAPPPPPRSTTPSSVTSSSSRTKSPATPVSKSSSSRVTRHGESSSGSGGTSRRTRRNTDFSIASDTDSDQSESESELSRTRSGCKSEEQQVTKKKPPPPSKRKDDDDTEKEDDDKPKRMKKMKKSPEKNPVIDSDDDDSCSPPKGRDFDLNQIRSELKGFEKAVKIATAESAASEASTSTSSSSSNEDKPAVSEAKPSTASDKKHEDKEKSSKQDKQTDKTQNTEDIYEFKEPEPFEFEARASKLSGSEDKSAKKRLVPRLFEELEKSPVKKKGAKSPPKTATDTKDNEDKKRPFKRSPAKKVDEEEKITLLECTPPSVKTRSESSCEDPFDKLVESPSFNICLEKKSPAMLIPTDTTSASGGSAATSSSKLKSVNALNMDETLSLFRELPETVGDDSRDRLDISDTDDIQTDPPLFTHKEPIFSDFNKPETSSIFRGFTGKCDSSDDKKRLMKDGASDEDDSITAAIQRAISNTMTDEESTEDDLFITQPTSIYQPKLKPKDEPKHTIIVSPAVAGVILPVPNATVKQEDIKEPLSINTQSKESKENTSSSSSSSSSRDNHSRTPKQISPALQETDSSLLEAISLKTEMLKKEEPREPQIKTGTKIADSILQKFNMIKKNEEIKPVKVEPKVEKIEAPVVVQPVLAVTVNTVDVVKEEKVVKEAVKEEKPAEVREVMVKEELPEPPPTPQQQPVIKIQQPVPQIQLLIAETEYPMNEIKKRPSKKFVSREFIDESDDSSDSEERLVIARSDDDSQTVPSDDKPDFKDTDSNTSAIHAHTDDSQEDERNFKLESIIKVDSVLPDSTTVDVVQSADVKVEQVDAAKQADDEPDSNISLLLCKETIPGSPAPVPEVSPAPAEPRIKPKSAKSLLLEMPFASAPGSSNSKAMLTNPSHESKQLNAKQQHQDAQPLALPLAMDQACDGNETNTVIDNTPPTTPESTMSNMSPRGEPGRISPNTADNESCKSTDSGHRAQSSKIAHYSEEDTIMTSEACSAPKKVTRGVDDIPASCRKRRRSCKALDELPPKRGRRANVRNVRANSDSDDTSEHSAPGSTPPASVLVHQAAASITIETRSSSRSPRPRKYNFVIELDPSLDCGQRISMLQQKLSELRKTYNNVKTELACIDRRRKKLRRREREAMKAAKQEMACS